MDDQPTLAELDVWTEETERNLERYRSLRRRCVGVPVEDRQRRLRDQGLLNLRELDSMIRLCRENLAHYERARRRAAAGERGPGAAVQTERT